MTSGTDKVRENRLRRMAARQGLMLRKTRRRDPLAYDYGTWTLLTSDRNPVAFGHLDKVEDYLTGGAK